MSELEEQIKRLESAIAQLEAQRAVLGDAVVDESIVALREKLDALSLSKQRSLLPEAEEGLHRTG